jgi:hypothetical protein
MQRLIELALRYRILVLLATVFVAAIGFISLRNLPIDAEPDITPNQVLVLTRAPSLSPLEVEPQMQAGPTVIGVMYEGRDAQCSAFEIHVDSRLKLVKAVKTSDHDESYGQ